MDMLQLLTVLATAPVDARIVLQLPNGDEVEVTDARHHCQLVVLRAAVPEVEPLDNSAYIKEAQCMFPAEDFLETGIESVRKQRMNQDFKNALIETLSDIQTTVAREAEYGRDELHKALAEIEQ